LTASVLPEVIRPAATLVMVRSAPGDPTLTVLVALAPANGPKTKPPTVTELVETVAAVVDPEPRATSPGKLAMAFKPMAMELVPTEVACGPTAMEFAPVAVESFRVELVWKYLIPRPFASALRVERPVESEPTPLTAVLIPDDAEVESEPTVLLVVDRPVESEPT